MQKDDHPSGKPKESPGDLLIKPTNFYTTLGHLNTYATLVNSKSRQFTSEIQRNYHLAQAWCDEFFEDSRMRNWVIIRSMRDLGYADETISATCPRLEHIRGDGGIYVGLCFAIADTCEKATGSHEITRSIFHSAWKRISNAQVNSMIRGFSAEELAHYQCRD
jgi:hypothetical protein